MNDNLYRIAIKGGVTSPGELMESIRLLETAGLKQVFFGSRQDLLFPITEESSASLDTLKKLHPHLIEDRSFQNIVCSYVSAEIYEMTDWLKGSTYLYLLEQFRYQPRLKINITDPKQRLVPLFSGNLNFIASEEEDYWYLNVLLPHWKERAYYPVLIYSWDIVRICEAIEAIHQTTDTIDQLFSRLNETISTNNKNSSKPLALPYKTFPYYEGMNRMGLDQYWLGLYWRNNRYDLSFLKDFCGFCLDHSIGKICITPWKSFITKGIKAEYRPQLERFLGKRGINVRHTQLEMNWHLPVDDREALELKNFLVRNFDQNDISTYGLTFGISNDNGKRTHFSSIVIEKNTSTKLTEHLKTNTTYNVIYSKNFDPNTHEYITYALDVDKSQLSPLLMELSKMYFDQLQPGIVSQAINTPQRNSEELKEVQQCPECLTVYDEREGDPKNQIDPDTAFSKIKDTYRCPVCETHASEFIPIQLAFPL